MMPDNQSRVSPPPMGADAAMVRYDAARAAEYERV
jgi:hypothetical protein